MNMKDKATDTEQRLIDKIEIAVRLDSELVEQIQHLTNDPSKVIEVAIRQWLRGDVPRDDELTRSPVRKPVPPRGEWNDWGIQASIIVIISGIVINWCGGIKKCQFC